MEYNLSFPTVNENVCCQGVIRTTDADFFVEEMMDVSLTGEGEHVWLFVEKRGENTDFIARRLAKHAGVREMDIGYSGLKDRHAITQQWFSVYLGSRPEPEWCLLEDDSLQILSHHRHSHKLRRGQHHANRFALRICQLEGDIASLEQALEAVKHRGFPNYFGEQRFGRGGANVNKAAAMFERRIKATKSKRGFYLSAARSFLFNRVLAERINQNSWLKAPSDGPLYGELPRDLVDKTFENDDPNGHVGCSQLERVIFEQYPALTKGLYANRLKMEGRPLSVVPQNMSWKVLGDVLEVGFLLPTGSFATSLLNEVVNYRVFERSYPSEKE
ncbi:tRNA pseudouridine(13) synthase TruD [Alkalimarinus sediminis]|uniref:tRNA pseudouridine synthase D n=1 Tax=Alkalimarinus sediminis TaxID=1632866 RepID=A0A9E8HTU9_9ALTE|nr:tRNA pseudouridine(13) synthase TruD [Alkalimarinus sediminis]UZW75629.1 tRNA pseudouridine(13) synthase TruD [Alkalimarinus sediminis]